MAFNLKYFIAAGAHPGGFSHKFQIEENFHGNA
jgi:hypothetical protein